MDVEVVYRQPNGTQIILGVRDMDDIPPIGKTIELDHRQYHAKSFGGPDAQGRYRLYVEDDPEATRH